MTTTVDNRTAAIDQPTPFDEMAPDFDRLFGECVIVNTMRRAVWRRLDARFQAGDRVVELNCGTAEDAVHLARRGVQVVATDISEPMVQVSRDKVDALGLGEMIDIRRVAAEQIGECRTSGPLFDGAFSNFGGLNCVRELSPVAEQLAGCLRPGAVALLCMMGPLCPWEWAWYLARRQPAKAFRRLRRGGTPWHNMTIYYPSIAAATRAFAPHFRMVRVSAVGALVPPTYVEEWAKRRPRAVGVLDRWERTLETVWPLPHFADHYLLELERV